MERLETIRGAAILAIALGGLASTAGPSPAAERPKVQVVLIGVEEAPGHADASRAVARLADVLGRGDGSHEVLRLDEAPGGEPPTLRSLRERAAPALTGLFATDIALVSYRGKVLEAGGKIYLALKGTDPADPAASALPLDELLRWLDEDDGRSEALLLIDAAGAGAVAEWPRTRSHLLASEAGGDFAGGLADALEGAADANGDATISLAELQQSLRDRARRAGTRLIQVDPPQQVLGDLVRLAPGPIGGAMESLARWADAAVRRERTDRVQIRPFGFKGDVDRTGGSRVLAGQIAADLKPLARRDYAVVEPEGRKGPPAGPAASHRIEGVYQVRKGPDRLLVHVEVVEAAGGRVIGQATRLVELDDNVRAQFLNDPIDRIKRPVAGAVGQARPIHRLLTKESPVAVEIVCADKPLRLKDDGAGNLEVDVPTAGEYQIRVENLWGPKMYLRLTIDGVNTVVQSDGDTDVSACLLEKARGYVLLPKLRYTFEGWILGVGEGAAVDRFAFVPFGEGVARRVQASGEDGVIAMAFYLERPAAKEGRIATGAGERVIRDVKIADPMRLDDDPFLTATIRYQSRPGGRLGILVRDPRPH